MPELLLEGKGYGLVQCGGSCRWCHSHADFVDTIVREQDASGAALRGGSGQAGDRSSWGVRLKGGALATVEVGGLASLQP